MEVELASAATRKSDWESSYFKPRDCKFPVIVETKFSPPLGALDRAKVAKSIVGEVSKICEVMTKPFFQYLPPWDQHSEGKDELTFETRTEISSEGFSSKRKFPSLLRIRTS